MAERLKNQIRFWRESYKNAAHIRPFFVLSWKHMTLATPGCPLSISEVAELHIRNHKHVLLHFYFLESDAGFFTS